LVSIEETSLSGDGHVGHSSFASKPMEIF